MEHAGYRKYRPSKAALPFGGLGLEFGLVFARAESLTLRTALPKGEPFRTGIDPGTTVVSGYELLLLLNREIRGC
jgi:hypothetical protein